MEQSYVVVTSDGIFRECSLCHALLDGQDRVGLPTEAEHYAEAHA